MHIIKKYLLSIVVMLPLLANAQFVNNTGILLVNTASITTNGDWQNSGPITNNGQITTTDNWINLGVLADSSTGGWTLDYLNDRSFTPNGSFGKLIKSNIGRALTTGSFAVRDTAILNSGVIVVTNAIDSITLGSGNGFVLQAAPASYIDGKVTRIDNGNLFFPVGLAGAAMPIRFYNVQGTSPVVSVTIAPAPAAGFSAGAGVKNVVTFPYMWTATKGDPADTAQYVEVEYPDTLLLPPTEPIIVFKSGASQYESLGQKSFVSAGGRVTLRSYTGALGQTFTVADGFVNDIVNDSLALVSMYTSTAGDLWVDKTGWKTAPIHTWFGVKLNGHSITQLVMPANNMVGPVPSGVSGIESLRLVNLTKNELTSFPDMSSLIQLTSLDVSENVLDFSSLINNMVIANFNYLNQKTLGTPTTQYVDVGTDYAVSVSDQTVGNEYQWSFKSQPINGATSYSYTITDVRRAKMGDYTVQFTNPSVPGLTLNTHPQTIIGTATLSGKLLISETAPATKGNVTLFLITPTGSYDTAYVKPVGADGSFLIDKVVLNDYQLMGFPDTLVHQKAMPTYYEGSIFWEEATTLALDENRTDLDIITQFEPTAPKAGDGEISGTIFQDDGTSGGRTKAKQPVAKAGVSVRRGQGSGRGQEDVLTLIDYVFTTEEGAFIFENLDAGSYWLNIQYPGFPMDSTSSINLVVGNTLKERNVFVEAEVLDGEIVVRKLVILGWQQPEMLMSVYPNPTSTSLFLNVPDKKPLTFEIVDASGRQHLTNFKSDRENSRWVIDVSALTKGVYLLNVIEKEKVKTLRFIIE